MISDNVLIALITGCFTSLVAIIALVINNKRFDRIERTLEIIQADLKEFYKEISRIKQKTGLD